MKLELKKMSLTSRNTKSDFLRAQTQAIETISNERKKLKIDFETNEKSQMLNYIKDLQKTIRINKEIITEMFNNSQKKGEADKLALKKLNQENNDLQIQLSHIVKERNNLQGELLIKNQIIANFSLKEQETANEYNEKIKELIDQLDQKEYVLQYLHYRQNRAEKILRKYLARDYQVKIYLGEINSNVDPPKGITNVIQENTELQNKLKEAQEKIQAQAQQEAVLRHLNEQLISAISELKICEKSYIEIDIKEPSQYQFLSPSEYSDKITEACGKLSTQLSLIQKENQMLHNQIQEQQEKINNLLKLNKFPNEKKVGRLKNYRTLSRSFGAGQTEKISPTAIQQKELLNSKLNVILENSIDFQQSFSAYPVVQEEKKGEIDSEVARGNVMEEETSFGDLSGIIKLPQAEMLENVEEEGSDTQSDTQYQLDNYLIK